MGVIQLSPEDLKSLRDVMDADPVSTKLRVLIVDYATKEGGQTLAFWRLFQGFLFGEPHMMSADEVAKRMGLPVSKMHAIYAETMEAVQPLWFSSPEYKANPPRHPQPPYRGADAG